MKAVRNSPPGVRIIDIDEPPGDGRLVKVAAVGICSSDLKYLAWGSTQIAGHEFAGTLEDGTAVAVEAIAGCGRCSQCERGDYNRCERGVQGLGMTDPGAMCEWYRAPERCLTVLPDGLDISAAPIVEPAAVAWHACNMGGVGPDTRTAVVGAGAIGVLAAASAQEMGAAEVCLAARHPHQHAARERIGASQPEGLFDVVIETAGSQSGLDLAFELVRPGGTVVHLGAYVNVEWPMQTAFMKEVALRASLGYGTHDGEREFTAAARMVARRPELASTLITHRFPISEAPEAFRTASDRSAGVFRVIVEPGDGR